MGDVAPNPRRFKVWRQARAQVIAEESTCWICGGSEFVSTPRHPMSRTVDHLIPLVHGGRLLERSNLRLAHLGCNSKRGAGSKTYGRPTEDW